MRLLVKILWPIFQYYVIGAILPTTPTVSGYFNHRLLRVMRWSVCFSVSLFTSRITQNEIRETGTLRTREDVVKFWRLGSCLGRARPEHAGNDTVPISTRRGGGIHPTECRCVYGSTTTWNMIGEGRCRGAEEWLILGVILPKDIRHDTGSQGSASSYTAREIAVADGVALLIRGLIRPLPLLDTNASFVSLRLQCRHQLNGRTVSRALECIRLSFRRLWYTLWRLRS